MKCQSLASRLQYWKPMAPSEALKESFFNILLKLKIKLISESQSHQSNHSIECNFSSGIRPSLLLMSSPMKLPTLAPTEDWNLRLLGKEKPHFCLIKDLKIYIFKIFFFSCRWISGGHFIMWLKLYLYCMCFPDYKVVRFWYKFNVNSYKETPQRAHGGNDIMINCFL